jgi:hypothetical protein
MEPNRTASVYEPEMDMNRHLGLAPVGRVKRLFGTVLRLRAGGHDIGRPRRSIDRRQQEYAPPSEN